MSATPQVILSVDDNDVDGALLERAFKRTGVPARLFRVSEGPQALAYLSGEGIYCDRENYPLPDSVLLDLAMPKMSGFDVLSWIRQHPVINKTTVLILTASDKPEDKQTASKIGADAYFVKPSKFEDLKKLVKSIETDWLGIKKTKPGVSAKKAAPQGTETQAAQPVLISESSLHAVAEPVA
jgi:CheY-like chemotaxis protein